MTIQTLDDREAGEKECLGLKNTHLCGPRPSLPGETNELRVVQSDPFEHERPMADPVPDASKEIVIEQVARLSQGWVVRVVASERHVQARGLRPQESSERTIDDEERGEPRRDKRTNRCRSSKSRCSVSVIGLSPPCVDELSRMDKRPQSGFAEGANAQIQRPAAGGSAAMLR